MAAAHRQRAKRQPASAKIWRKVSGFARRELLTLHFLKDPNSAWIAASLLMVLEVFVTVLVIEKIPYTEIDWKAYMQEVEGVVNGTLDYQELKGDTGPLVYPAGFVYVFLLLYGITQRGANIYLAQYLFACLYLGTLGLVFRLYKKTKVVPPYALVFMCCTSYRIHSIYVLRLFNDPVALFFLFLALNCFVEDRWTLGCGLFSFAVSVKMNILLFAPGLLYLLLSRNGIYDALNKIVLCAAVQLGLALPFLAANPWGYLAGAFDVGRVFLFQWSVNWRMLPEQLFLSRSFHAALLALHAAAILLFYLKWNRQFHSTNSLWPRACRSSISADSILSVLYTSNFLGVLLCRSLHYQFYAWYFFSLPHLLWLAPFAPAAKLCVLGILELTWNAFPATALSSALMQCCHLAILAGLLAGGGSGRQAGAKELKSG